MNRVRRWLHVRQLSGPKRIVLASVATVAIGGTLGWYVLAGLRAPEMTSGGANRSYRIGYRETAPYLFTKTDGLPGGLAVDVLNAASQRAGVRLEWVKTNRLNYEFLVAGSGELWPLADVEDSHQFATTRPWLRDTFSLVTRRGTVHHKRIGVNDSPRTMALFRGRYPEAQPVPVAGGGEALAALCDGKVDGVFINSRVSYQLLLDRPAGCAAVALHVEPVADLHLPLGILYQPGSKDVAERLRKAIDEMLIDGTLGAIFSRWAQSANNEVELSALLMESQRRSSRAMGMAGVAGVLFLFLAFVATILYRAQAAAISANRAKTQFLAMVSHELRTPMQGVIGVLDLLIDSSPTGEQRSLLGTALSGAKSLRRIVDDILECSRFDAMRFVLNPAPLDLTQLVRDVASQIQPRFVEKGLALHVDLPTALPLVHADAARLHQVLLNLLDNAVKFTGTGSATVRVRCHAGAGEMVRLCIEVTDSGIGMDPARAPQLFAAFAQESRGDSRRFGGLGLGLAVCKGIVDAMSGSIVLDTAEGRGTTVRIQVTVPVVAARPAPMANREVAGPRRILVVDDNSVNRLLVSKMLQKLGHSVAAASDGVMGVAMFQAEGFELILMDCEMPHLDGFAATRQIRALEESAGELRCEIVALTASVDPEDQQRCMAAGMDGFLGKPVTIAELDAVVRGTPLGGRRERASG